jgi:dephospho-CoA kinase
MPSPSPSPRSQTDALFVGFAGHIGAGKTSAANYLSSKYGFQYARYSQVLRDWLASEAPGRDGLQDFGWEVMAGGRQVQLNARLIAGLSRSQSAAIDGLRHYIDFHSLSYAFGASFRLVFLEAAAEARFKRTKSRFSTYEAFLAADSHPVEAQIDSLKPLAAATIPTEESLEGLYRRLDGWVASYGTGDQK